MASTPPPPMLQPGDRLDRYEILAKLGKGGMATVWLARARPKHPSVVGVDHLVALKTMLPEVAVQSEFRTMFIDEARIASQIDHPNVARIVDAGEDRGTLYMAMEYVSGESLARLRRKLAERKEPIRVQMLLRVLADTCTALHAAHELVGADGVPLEIVHRDVSPQNILISDHGTVKLIDFGIAKASGRLAGETSAGTIKGKLQYMAPEQALGVAGRTADVWAVGAVAYHFLAGAIPFDGPNEAAQLLRLVTGEPAPLPGHVPSSVGSIVMRALAHSSKDRFATAAELGDALEKALLDLGGHVSPRDLAAYVRECLRDNGDDRRSRITIALQAARDRERIAPSLLVQSDGDSSSGALPKRASHAASRSSGSVSVGVDSGLPVVSSVGFGPGERSERRWFGMGVAAVVGVVSAVTLLTIVQSWIPPAKATAQSLSPPAQVEMGQVNHGLDTGSVDPSPPASGPSATNIDGGMEARSTQPITPATFQVPSHSRRLPPAARSQKRPRGDDDTIF